MDSTKIKLESNSQITVLSRVYIEMPQDTAGMGLTGKAKVKLGEKWITVQYITTSSLTGRKGYKTVSKGRRAKHDET